jgi:hypothetical protein
MPPFHELSPDSALIVVIAGVAVMSWLLLFED